MGKRRRAREAAVQYHFWRDLQHGEGPDNIDDFWEFCPATPRVREFAQPLIEGMVAHLPEIDERIRRYCENYEFRRISAVDRRSSPSTRRSNWRKRTAARIPGDL
jgi:N utilization substance protein B